MTVAVHQPNPETNYFAQRPPERMKHFSVGALIMNAEGKIAVQKLTRKSVDWKDDAANLHSHEHPETTFYFLPTSTHSPDTTLEATLALAGKKVGWEIKPKTYIGVIESDFPVPQSSEKVVKHTLWMTAEPVTEIGRDPEARDADAEVLWLTIAELNEVFAAQANQGRDRDQRNVLALMEA